MDAELNAYEVLEIAERIERNGAQFYRKAAGLCADPGVGKLFVDLAQWESKHMDIFTKMKGQFSQERWEHGQFEPRRVGQPPARTMAALAVFGIHPNPAEELSGRETKADILRIAIQKERDSIVYYAGLRDFIPAEIDRKIIEGVIREEMRHVRILTQSLEQYM